MARPEPTAATERIYAHVPAAYRDEDESLDFPLLRYTSLEGDIVGEIEDLVDRINYVPPRDGGAAGDTSDLADPATTLPRWLSWLAMHRGIDASTRTAAETRAAIAGANGQRPGSNGAIKRAVQSVLSGNRIVRLIRHVDGDEWKLRVQIFSGESPGFTYDELSAEFATYDEFAAAYPSYDSIPSSAAVLAVAMTEKPAGVELELEVLLGATYDDLSAEFATYDDLTGAFATYDDMTTHLPGGA